MQFSGVFEFVCYLPPVVGGDAGVEELDDELDDAALQAPYCGSVQQAPY